MWGATGGWFIIGFDTDISIHAPRVGRDQHRSWCPRWPAYFNPRAPCGARRSCAHAAPSLRNFNPRAPCGARLFWLISSVFALMISIHAPRVGRDVSLTSIVMPPSYFNPRAPCGARRYRCGHSSACGYFNPRAPCGARQEAQPSPRPHHDFNPRAPCGARRILLVAVSVCFQNFNPRAPCGARRGVRPHLLRLSNFNPRAPCGARLQLINAHRQDIKI